MSDQQNPAPNGAAPEGSFFGKRGGAGREAVVGYAAPPPPPGQEPAPAPTGLDAVPDAPPAPEAPTGPSTFGADTGAFGGEAVAAPIAETPSYDPAAAVPPAVDAAPLPDAATTELSAPAEVPIMDPSLAAAPVEASAPEAAPAVGGWQPPSFSDAFKDNNDVAPAAEAAPVEAPVAEAAPLTPTPEIAEAAQEIHTGDLPPIGGEQPAAFTAEAFDAPAPTVAPTEEISAAADTPLSATGTEYAHAPAVEGDLEPLPAMDASSDAEPDLEEKFNAIDPGMRATMGFPASFGEMTPDHLAALGEMHVVVPPTHDPEGPEAGEIDAASFGEMPAPAEANPAAEVAATAETPERRHSEATYAAIDKINAVLDAPELHQIEGDAQLHGRALKVMLTDIESEQGEMKLYRQGFQDLEKVLHCVEGDAREQLLDASEALLRENMITSVDLNANTQNNALTAIAQGAQVSAALKQQEAQANAGKHQAALDRQRAAEEHFAEHGSGGNYL